MKIYNKKVGEVFETNNYEMFKKLKGNRDTIPAHVKRLGLSFLKCYLQNPILINEQHEIIDGQNRAQAAKEHGLPIYYTIKEGYGLKETQILNANSADWDKYTYLNSFCESGYPEYIKFRNFMLRYPDFGLLACLYILTDKTVASRNSSNVTLKSDTNKRGSYVAHDDFTSGNLKIIDFNKSIETAEKIIMIKPFYKGFSRTVFIKAMITIFQNKDYDHNTFLQRLKVNQSMMKDCGKVSQYKEVIEEIYNFRSRKPIHLRF